MGLEEQRDVGNYGNCVKARLLYFYFLVVVMKRFCSGPPSTIEGVSVIGRVNKNEKTGQTLDIKK